MAVAASIRERLAGEVAEFQAASEVTPHLAAVLVGDDPASAVYVRNKEADCAKVGIRSTLHRLGADTTQEQLLALVKQLNDGKSVHGILVQLPLPPHVDAVAVLDALHVAEPAFVCGVSMGGYIAQHVAARYVFVRGPSLPTRAWHACRRTGHFRTPH